MEIPILDITGTHGDDRHERLIIDLAADDKDIGQAGIEAGFIKAGGMMGRSS